jgi:hypothetical protein
VIGRKGSPIACRSTWGPHERIPPPHTLVRTVAVGETKPNARCLTMMMVMMMHDVASLLILVNTQKHPRSGRPRRPVMIMMIDTAPYAEGVEQSSLKA